MQPRSINLEPPMRALPALLSCLLTALALPAAATVFVPLDPQATYLRANESPVPPAALALSLADLGVAAGDRLQLEVVGDIDNGPGGDTFTFTLGLFSSSNTLLGTSLAARVPGALASDGPPVVTASTYWGSLATDIAQDFGFDTPLGAIVTVPVGAAYLFLAKHDELYMDNSDPDHDYGVRITLLPAVPEPGTWAMFAAGLAWLGRRAWRPGR